MLSGRFARIMKFTVNPTARGHLNPSEIRLHESRDSGNRLSQLLTSNELR
jgi:hypothetical protein